MKKVIILCALLLLFGLAGCADSAPPAQEPTQETAGATTETLESTPIETPAVELPQLSAEREMQIRENFRIWWGWDDSPSEIDPDFRLRLFYFGTFNGREVVWIDGGGDEAEMLEEVAGYTFWFGHLGSHVGKHVNDWGDDGGVHIWLHDDGDWMCFCIGYERGYLTAEDIGLIWERYMGNMGE